MVYYTHWCSYYFEFLIELFASHILVFFEKVNVVYKNIS